MTEHSNIEPVCKLCQSQAQGQTEKGLCIQIWVSWPMLQTSGQNEARSRSFYNKENSRFWPFNDSSPFLNIYVAFSFYSSKNVCKP